VDAEVFPETTDNNNEKHHGPPKGKVKIKSAKFIDEEAMFFQDSLLHGSRDNTTGE